LKNNFQTAKYGKFSLGLTKYNGHEEVWVSRGLAPRIS